MNFFKNKTNILLTCLLSLVIGTAVFFVLMFTKSKDAVIVPDFNNKSISEVKTWCNSLENNPCSFTSDYSDNVKKDLIIYQSIKADDKLEGNISFIVSLGKKVVINLPTIDENTNKETIETWALENAITNISYIEEYSDEVESGIVIRITPNNVITLDDKVTVYISKGSKDESTNSVIHVDADEYIKLTQSAFEQKAKSLGLTPSYVSKKDDYSSTIEKGSVLWHGSGDYIKDEEIHYSLSLGKKEGDTSIEIKTEEYIGKTEEELKEIITKLGLTPNHGHSTYTDEYSDKYEKGTVIWHGSGTYEKDEKFNYVLSLGKKKTDGPVTIEANQYVGKTEDEIKKIASELGLTANHGHSTHTDEYSDKYAKGTVIWHGSGTYEPEEKFNYVLSLGKKDSDSKSVNISYNAYVGKTEAEVKEAITKLGLTPNHGHSTYTDEYSDTYAKGTVIWHGSGTYEAGEKFNYVLSLGSVPKVNVVSKAGVSESEFKNYITGLGLKVGSKTSDYSSSVAAGLIISNDTGSFAANSSINYKVSLGKDTRVNVDSYEGQDASSLESFISSNGLVGNKSTQYSDTIAQGNVISNTTGLLNAGATVSYVVSLGEEMGTIMLADYYNSYRGESFDATKKNLSTGSGPFKKFTNVTYTGVKNDKTAGVIISVKIDGYSISNTGDRKPGEYALSTPIEITISTGY